MYPIYFVTLWSTRLIKPLPPIHHFPSYPYCYYDPSSSISEPSLIISYPTLTPTILNRIICLIYPLSTPFWNQWKTLKQESNHPSHSLNHFVLQLNSRLKALELPHLFMSSLLSFSDCVNCPGRGRRFHPLSLTPFLLRSSHFGHL